MSAGLFDLTVISNYTLPSGCCILELKTADDAELPVCAPGQFVQVLVDAPDVFLRRPFSICDVKGNKELTLFIKPVGRGSRHLVSLTPGSKLNIMLPLGHGFSCDLSVKNQNVLLVGGGVGAAPLVYLSKKLCEEGANVTVALGGRTAQDISGVDKLYATAREVIVSTDNGSLGHSGIITHNPIFNEQFDRIYCCGPDPMMKAVAEIARNKGIWCEVSLENSMACGLGACLCCVQETESEGNVCVCTEGPVFNINRLGKWR